MKKKKSFYKKNADILFVFFLLVLLFIAVFTATLRVNGDSLPLASSLPVRNLIASLSAQKQPIKIDPKFSFHSQEIKGDSPVRIVIPSAKIDVSVVEAPIIDGFWETATDSASFGLGSAYPSETGNTVIFAHARQGLFENLRLTKKEDMIYIFTKSRWYAYKTKEIKSVLPNQVEVVSPTLDKTLTLYTCDGYRDTYRLVIVAKPVQ